MEYYVAIENDIVKIYLLPHTIEWTTAQSIIFLLLYFSGMDLLLFIPICMPTLSPTRVHMKIIKLVTAGW